MKAALCKSLEGPSALVVEDIDKPDPGPGEVVVRIKAAALNFLDTLITRGKYQYKPEPPFSPAAEVAGVVEEIGAGASGFAIGERVCGYLGWGGARELVAVPAVQLVPVPGRVSDVVAAGVNVTYGTAMHGLVDRARLRAGETVAVLGAAGGAGLAAVEIAKRIGARVIAVASSADKLALCRRHGADAGLDYSTTDLKQGLRELTAGRGVDIVYDCVGGDSAEAALRAIAWMGRYLVVGFAAGAIPKIPLNLLLLKSCDVSGVFWGEATRRNPAAHRANMGTVLSWIAEGRLAPHIHATYPLEETAAAIAVLDRREATGKVVIVM
jgi:NADPH2:quinone reductase